MKSRLSDERRGCRGWLVWVFILSCAWSSPAQAQEDELWARIFGDGMRAWAESDYDRALEMLYQSYAIKPTSYNLSLIVRSHDFLGECDAATRQRDEFKGLYTKVKSPRLQYCASSGTLIMECPESREGLRVRISGRERGLCGEAIVVPVGSHEVSVSDVGYAASVTIKKAKVHRHALASASSMAEGKEIKGRPHVSKLLSTADRYTIFMTPDGLYQIWVLNDDPELLHPYEGNLCTRSESEGKASCQPLTKSQRDELEKVAPMILLLPD